LNKRELQQKKNNSKRIWLHRAQKIVNGSKADAINRTLVPFGAKVKQQEVRRVAHDIVLFI
jgi:hypothetical protein